MERMRTISWMVPAAAALGLTLLHFAGSTDPDPAVPASAPAAAPTPSTADVQARLDEQRQEWRAMHLPSVTDVGAERDDKELYRRMKLLGTSPVELLPADQQMGGLRVGEGVADRELFLAQGGHVAGPVRAQAAPTEEDGK